MSESLLRNPNLETNGTPSLTDRVQALRLNNHLNGKEKNSASWLPWILCLLMGLTWASIGVRYLNSAGSPVSSSSGTMPSTNTISEESRTASSSSVTPATNVASSGETVLNVRGYIIAARQINISPIEVSGRIISLDIEEGKFVSEGSELARIDDTPYLADVREAEANLRLAQARLKEVQSSPEVQEERDLVQAELEEAKALLEQYRKELLRTKELIGRGLAQRDLDQAESQYRSQAERVRRLSLSLTLVEKRNRRDERIQQLQAEVAQAEARLARAIWRHNNCIIRAPVTGTILSKKAERGNFVNSLANNSAFASGLGEIADLSDLEVDLEVQERDISKVFVGQLCKIKPEAYSKREYEGYVDRLMPIANRSRSVVPIRVKIIIPEEEDGARYYRERYNIVFSSLCSGVGKLRPVTTYLKPEMGANVFFLNRESEIWKKQNPVLPPSPDPKSVNTASK